MEQLLGDDYESFLEGFQEEQTYGLRLNPLKVTQEEWKKINPFTLQKIPWAADGFYYDHKERPGKHPFHEAGLYYIQEPSAMAVVEAMEPKPGEKILDLAAAPGGKATHIAAKMKGKGLLVANDIHPRRARALSENIERLGIRNAIVTSERPNRLVKYFPNFFDRILLDAPCSGEGMFRKDKEAIDHCSLDNVKTCAIRQLDILDQASKLLKPGGLLVYSTCTFAPEENEQVINDFLKKYPDYTVEISSLTNQFSSGREDWVVEPVQGLDQTIRIWPHQVKGEGHFIALLRKNPTSSKQSKRVKPLRSLKSKQVVASFYDFSKENLQKIPEGPYVLFGDELYAVPEEMVTMEGLKVIRAGWHLGTKRKNRFEPRSEERRVGKGCT